MSNKSIEVTALKLLAEVMRFKLLHLDGKASGDMNEADSRLEDVVKFVADDLLGDIATLRDLIASIEQKANVADF